MTWPSSKPDEVVDAQLGEILRGRPSAAFR